MRGGDMKKRIVTFFAILLGLVLIPILIFPLNGSIEKAQFDLALELFKKENYDSAIDEFNRLLFDLKTNKFLDASYFYIGNSHLSMKRYEEARRNFKYIVDNLYESDYYSQSLYLFGRSEYLMKNFSAAIGKFDLYLKQYAALDYADNSMYWKAESLIGEGRRDDARTVLNALLKHYPYGNKADAARFKLRLMELEDELAGKRDAALRNRGEDEGGTVSEDLENWKDRELQYSSEIEKLINRVEMLESEINALKEIEEGTEDERVAQIEEKIEALIAWENILNMKEEALNQKEMQLDQEFARIQELSEQLEPASDD
jgi:TolA-binding protein